MQSFPNPFSGRPLSFPLPRNLTRQPRRCLAGCLTNAPHAFAPPAATSPPAPRYPHPGVRSTLPLTPRAERQRRPGSSQRGRIRGGAALCPRRGGTKNLTSQRENSAELSRDSAIRIAHKPLSLLRSRSSQRLCLCATATFLEPSIFASIQLPHIHARLQLGRAHRGASRRLNSKQPDLAFRAKQKVNRGLRG
jgi:hypothetical protein